MIVLLRMQKKKNIAQENKITKWDLTLDTLF